MIHLVFLFEFLDCYEGAEMEGHNITVLFPAQRRGGCAGGMVNVFGMKRISLTWLFGDLSHTPFWGYYLAIKMESLTLGLQQSEP